MALFTNQKQGGPGGAGGHPGKLDVDAQVRSMRSSGLTDDQILSELKSQGAKETQVINSLGKISSEMPMSGADMMGGPNDIDLGMGAPPGAARGMPNMGAPAAGGADSGFRLPTPPAGAMGPGMSGAGRSKGQSGSEDLYERIEEIAEEMIDEKWDDLIKEVQKIIAWKNKSGTRA